MTGYPFYSPIGQPGGYDLYDSVTDLLSEGFPESTPVEVDRGHGTDIETTTIGELRAWLARGPFVSGYYASATDDDTSEE